MSVFRGLEEGKQHIFKVVTLGFMICVCIMVEIVIKCLKPRVNSNVKYEFSVMIH
jgi:hypothetical protein